MSSIQVYRSPDLTFRQGDVFEGVPIAQPLATPYLTVGTPIERKGVMTAQVFGIAGNAALPDAVANGRSPGDFIAKIRLQRAILLTRGCDVDKGRPLQFAPIRPLSVVSGEAAQLAIVEGRHANCHFLPGDDSLNLPVSFVDFRTITSVASGSLPNFRRVTSLTHSALKSVYFSMVRHITRAQLVDDANCDACGAPVSVLREIPRLMEPPEDY